MALARADPPQEAGGEEDDASSMTQSERDEFVAAIEKRNELLRRCMRALSASSVQSVFSQGPARPGPPDPHAPPPPSDRDRNSESARSPASPIRPLPGSASPAPTASSPSPLPAAVLRNNNDTISITNAPASGIRAASAPPPSSSSDDPRDGRASAFGNDSARAASGFAPQSSRQSPLNLAASLAGAAQGDGSADPQAGESHLPYSHLDTWNASANEPAAQQHTVASTPTSATDTGQRFGGAPVLHRYHVASVSGEQADTKETNREHDQELATRPDASSASVHRPDVESCHVTGTNLGVRMALHAAAPPADQSHSLDQQPAYAVYHADQTLVQEPVLQNDSHPHKTLRQLVQNQQQHQGAAHNDEQLLLQSSPQTKDAQGMETRERIVAFAEPSPDKQQQQQQQQQQGIAYQPEQQAGKVSEEEDGEVLRPNQLPRLSELSSHPPKSLEEKEHEGVSVNSSSARNSDSVTSVSASQTDVDEDRDARAVLVTSRDNYRPRPKSQKTVKEQRRSSATNLAAIFDEALGQEPDKADKDHNAHEAHSENRQAIGESAREDDEENDSSRTSMPASGADANADSKHMRTDVYEKGLSRRIRNEGDASETIDTREGIFSQQGESREPQTQSASSGRRGRHHSTTKAEEGAMPGERKRGGEAVEQKTPERQGQHDHGQCRNFVWRHAMYGESSASRFDAEQSRKSHASERSKSPAAGAVDESPTTPACAFDALTGDALAAKTPLDRDPRVDSAMADMRSISDGIQGERFSYGSIRASSAGGDPKIHARDAASQHDPRQQSAPPGFASESDAFRNHLRSLIPKQSCSSANSDKGGAGGSIDSQSLNAEDAGGRSCQKGESDDAPDATGLYFADLAAKRLFGHRIYYCRGSVQSVQPLPILLF